MDDIEIALTDIAMCIEEALNLRRDRRIATLRRLAAAAKVRNLAEFTFEDVELTDEQWAQTQRDISLQLGATSAEN